MKTILAYGDSLTWGADPVTGLRHPREDQWPVVLGHGLGDGVEVIRDGVGGRTTAWQDGAGPCERSAALTLPVALCAHMPLDLVILMLGTNDLKPVHGGVAEAAEAGMKLLIHQVKTFQYKPASAVPQVLIVAPPPSQISEKVRRHHDKRMEESRLIAPMYEALAKSSGCGFFDAATVCQASAEDGIHMTRDNTRALGAALVPVVRAMLG